MSVMCKWGSKKWKVNKKLVKPMDSLSYDMSYDKDKKKKDKRTISFSYTVYLETGVKVRKEITSWYKKIGKKNGLYIGAKRFGPKKMRLDSVKASDIKVMENGKIHYATIQLSFAEP